MAELDAEGIKYLVVGGIAVGLYAEPRFTKDLDVLVAVSPDSVEGLLTALKRFGAPVGLVSADEFLKEDFIFYFGVPPWRIDILTSIPGIEFGEAYENRTTVDFGGRPATFISKDDLIRSKLASGRPQDLLDAQNLGRP